MSQGRSSFRRAVGLILMSLGMMAAASDPGEGALHPVLQTWLESSKHLTTFHATVVQTRHLQAIREPLVSAGEIWFAAPGRFRWELGQPPQSIALRTPEELVVLSPRLRRAERYPQGTGSSGPEKELMHLLDVGFPRDAREFQSRFELVEVSTNTSGVLLRLRPRSAAARRLMPELTVGLDPGLSVLRLTELTFADGSRMRNEFISVITNGPMSGDLFVTNLDVSWKVSAGGAGR